MRRAFTLIELLVVVAIIGLLVSILLPSLRNAREQAKTTVCLANQKTLALAFMQYSIDNADRIPPATMDFDKVGQWVEWPQRPNGNRLFAFQLAGLTQLEPQLRGIREGVLFPFTLDEQVYHCPSDRRDTPNPERGAMAWRTYSMLNCMNGSPDDETNIGGTIVAELTTQITRPAERIVFLEEADPRGVNMGSWIMWLNRESWIDPLTVWHLEKSTLGFADGHAEVHAWQDDRTINQARDQIINADATDNVDWEYIRYRWLVR